MRNRRPSARPRQPTGVRSQAVDDPFIEGIVLTVVVSLGAFLTWMALTMVAAIVEVTVTQSGVGSITPTATAALVGGGWLVLMRGIWGTQRDVGRRAHAADESAGGPSV